MHGFIGVLAVAVWACGSVTAGAWLRAPGQSFVAVTGTVRTNDGLLTESETGIYAEHGLARRLTLGLDLNDRARTSGHALIFARVPLSKGPGLSKWAFEVGVGGHHYQSDWRRMLKATLSYGRTLPTRRGYGWIALDGGIEFRSGSQGRLHKLDAVIGLPVTPKLKALLKVETNHASDRPFVYAVTPGVLLGAPSATRWVLGLEHRHESLRTTGLRLEIWRTF